MRAQMGDLMMFWYVVRLSMLLVIMTDGQNCVGAVRTGTLQAQTVFDVLCTWGEQGLPSGVQQLNTPDDLKNLAAELSGGKVAQPLMPPAPRIQAPAQTVSGILKAWGQQGLPAEVGQLNKAPDLQRLAQYYTGESRLQPTQSPTSPSVLSSELSSVRPDIRDLYQAIQSTLQAQNPALWNRFLAEAESDWQNYFRTESPELFNDNDNKVLYISIHSMAEVLYGQHHRVQEPVQTAGSFVSTFGLMGSDLGRSFGSFYMTDPRTSGGLQVLNTMLSSYIPGKYPKNFPSKQSTNPSSSPTTSSSPAPASSSALSPAPAGQRTPPLSLRASIGTATEVFNWFGNNLRIKAWAESTGGTYEDCINGNNFGIFMQQFEAMRRTDPTWKTSVYSWDRNQKLTKVSGTPSSERYDTAGLENISAEELVTWLSTQLGFATFRDRGYREFGYVGGDYLGSFVQAIIKFIQATPNWQTTQGTWSVRGTAIYLPES